MLKATEDQLESMWNEVIGLLGIKVGTEEEEYLLQEDLRNLNEWMLREYSFLTCEEVRLAFNLACKGRLDIKPNDIFSILAPKHIGAVLSSYHRYTENDPEITGVFRSQQHVEEPQMEQAEIDAFMENVYANAFQQVANGHMVEDTGSGLYDWLYSKGRIQFTHQEREDIWKRAINELRWLLAHNPGGRFMPGSTRQRMLEDLASINSGEDLTDSACGRVIKHAKYLALNAHLIRNLPTVT